MKTDIRTMGLLAVLGLGGVTFGCSSSHTAPPPDQPSAATATATATTPATVTSAAMTTATAAPDPSPSDSAAAEPTAETKTSAPVTVTFTSSAKSGTVVLTLTVQALADIPHGVSRIVVPKELTVVKGDRELDLGALVKGATRTQQVTLTVPATGHYSIFAGVDCHLTPGISLHKTAKPITLGE